MSCLTETSMCPICLNENINEKQTTTCGHDFCKGCLSRWLETKHNCPLCRTSLREVVSREENSGRELPHHNINFSNISLTFDIVETNPQGNVNMNIGFDSIIRGFQMVDANNNPLTSVITSQQHYPSLRTMSSRAVLQHQLYWAAFNEEEDAIHRRDEQIQTQRAEQKARNSARRYRR